MHSEESAQQVLQICVYILMEIPKFSKDAKYIKIF